MTNFSSEHLTVLPFWMSRINKTKPVLGSIITIGEFKWLFAWHGLMHVKFWIHANCFILGELYDLYWGNYIPDLKIILGLPWYAKIKYVYMTINLRFSAREQVKILMTKEKLLKFSVRNKNKLNIPNLILTISKTTWPRRNLQISFFFLLFI